MAYSLEHMFEVWDDSTGECLEVGPDRDGLDLIEIRERDDHKIVARISMTKAKAALVAKALAMLATEAECSAGRNDNAEAK